MTAPRRRVTQQDIARMTGVSQSTVSIVLNGRSESDVRIAPETRDRVLRAIAETGYVADPIARRLGSRHNRILGVFTYEAVFPSANSDFYHPFLVGIEERAEGLGCDLLLLTSSPVVDGRRRIFHEDNRLRLADGCVLLGRSLDRAELTRLVADGLPFVSVGRRDDAGGPVPYVGADYAAAVAALVRRATGLGHTTLIYLGEGGGPESHADRMSGFRAAVAEVPGTTGRHELAVGRTPDELLDLVLDNGATAVFAEEHADGVALVAAAEKRGLAVPADLSVLTLGDPTRTAPAGPADLEFSGFRIPRRRMGWEAVEVLTALIEGTQTSTQRLLECEFVPGATLAQPRGI
ncbi:DNA-binding LacI/PurR family transcriptional regulator [Allocatelliglobosispora scoriae]|uniref:DNA-binding LacI/PurR family transcriptional regulator n=1 Tax=Allocatelliglobosispora scoriae TaxID=643052 RepID=A0A841BQD8_9ACTN|nr:LacI family DNA-binding transcriptional regulator [Allocatelliglobosispora scoriae]MBB5868972.1 DNA-binding LacI/PurR family transcriptional regulator [Allocatelliglobosispora scoriae]